MLPPQLLDDIQARIDQGDEFLNADDFPQALELYGQALSLIPEPRYQYEIALPAFTALGEALFFSGRYPDALSAFREAAKSPGGIENPLVHLRMGETYYELGDFERAADALTRAYMLEGRTLFDGEDEKYFSFLASRLAL
jgi:tetratricopeptide (TPR) repeat protein